MKRIKIFKRDQLKQRIKQGHLGIILVFILLIIVTNYGCKKDLVNSDEYYIKYEVNSSTIYSGGKLNVVLKDENNQDKNTTINTRSLWENVIGPVKKGFAANLSVSEVGNNNGQLKLYAQISISKNGSPFALKKDDNSDVSRTSVQINYTINY